MFTVKLPVRPAAVREHAAASERLMPHRRARQANLQGQIDTLDAQAADRNAYLKLADDLEGFVAQLRGQAATATVAERPRQRPPHRPREDHHPVPHPRPRR